MKITLTYYLILIMQLLSCSALLAQDEIEFVSNSSQNTSNSEQKTKVLVKPLADIKVNRIAESDKPALDRYIHIYVNENQAIRTRNTKSLVAKKLEVQEKDLLYPSMYKALGYENWNQVVSIPPELSSLRFSKQHEVLNLKLLARLHDSWALLDSTLFRIQYGKDTWVEPLIRRNLGLSAIHSWYRGGFNTEYIAALNKLNANAEVTLKSIEKIRSNLDKKTWNNAQIKLLKLKADTAELTQFYFLGVSDVFLNAGLSGLPKDDVFQVLKFNTKTECLAQAQAMEEGLELLVRRFPAEMRLIKSSQFDDIESNWQINKIAHELSKIALLFPHKEQAQYAVYALTDLVLERVLMLNQARLNKFLSKTDSFFQDKGSVLLFRGINVLQASLHEIFELTLLDYLLAGERASFANLMMHRKCILSKPNTDVPVFFSNILNNQFTANLDVERFTVFNKERINQHVLLNSVEHKSFKQEAAKQVVPHIQPKEHTLLNTAVLGSSDVAKLAVNTDSIPIEKITKENSKLSNVKTVSDEKDIVISSNTNKIERNVQPKEHALPKNIIVLDSLDAIELAVNINSTPLEAHTKENSGLPTSVEIVSDKKNVVIPIGRSETEPNVQSKEHVFKRLDVLEVLDNLELVANNSSVPLETIQQESLGSSSVETTSIENSVVAHDNIKNIDNIRGADFLTAESIMEKRNIRLLSEESVKEVFKGRGYTMQVVSTTSPNDVEYLVRRYKKRSDDVFVYLSKVTVEDEKISIFKILVGSHKAEDVSKAEYFKLLDAAKKRKAFLKPYSFVRADVAKAS